MPLVYDPPPIYRGGPRHAPTPALSHQTCPASFQRSFPSVFPPRSSLCSDEDEDEQMFTVGSSEIPVFSSSDTRSHIDAATPSISHLLSAHGEVTVHKLQVRIGDSAEFGIQDCCCQACLDSWGTPLTQSNRSPDKLARMSNVEDVTMIDWISALRHSFLFELCIDKAEFLPSTHRWDAPPQRHGCPVDGAQCSAVRHNHSEWRCTWAYRRLSISLHLGDVVLAHNGALSALLDSATQSINGLLQLRSALADDWASSSWRICSPARRRSSPHLQLHKHTGDANVVAHARDASRTTDAPRGQQHYRNGDGYGVEDGNEHQYHGNGDGNASGNGGGDEDGDGNGDDGDDDGDGG
eukprot:gene17009-biopygen4214